MDSIDKQMRTAFLMKEALLTAYDPEAIILFGSIGRGDGDEFSDVDLLVVIETDRNTEELGHEMTQYLDSISEEKHIIVRTPREFCRQVDIPGTLVYSTVQEGKILFDNETWRENNRSREPYESRKREIIKKDYVQSSREFLDQAETWLKKGNLFRFRDSIRFALARAIKGLFVKHNLHPPREIDLNLLLIQASELEHDLSRQRGLIKDLQDYFPNKANDQELKRGDHMLKRVIKGVDEITSICNT
jgi:predicted nucleotidyltransferase